LTQDEALRLAFPEPALVERHTAFLDDEDIAAARDLAGKGVELASRVVTYYTGVSDDGEVLGAAYFDSHLVRTLHEVLMIVVTPDDRIDRIEVLRFDEPPEYLVPDDWIAQLEGKALDDELSLKGSVVNMTGATLTSEAIVAAGRRALAVHAVIRPLDRGNE
jgi:Na+-translocating ferredoxin:NAD+ oxidoreductase RnfG subunit